MNSKDVIDPQVIFRDDGRCVIIDSATGQVVDDAQGYGYRTRQSAQKVLWYRFQGGHEKIAQKSPGSKPGNPRNEPHPESISERDALLYLVNRLRHAINRVDNSRDTYQLLNVVHVYAKAYGWKELL